MAEEEERQIRMHEFDMKFYAMLHDIEDNKRDATITITNGRTGEVIQKVEWKKGRIVG